MYEFIVQNWKYIFLIGIIILGALGYIEKILNLHWSRKWLLVLLILFIIISVGQIKLSLDTDSKINSLQADFDESKTELSKLREKTSSRRLKEDQRQALVKKLLTVQMRYPIVVVCRMMDVEACNYAKDLSAVFRQANWTVGEINRTFLDDIESDVTIFKTNDEQEEVADRIASVFNSVGIECKPENIRENSLSVNEPNTIYLVVGTKHN
ncbi:MAG: hypothetical protein HYW01_04510 [Deltaproteobacteria bacterium]|nr:hypothetical protein [Deltaproteobacteria bacterium]